MGFVAPKNMAEISGIIEVDRLWERETPKEWVLKRLFKLGVLMPLERILISRMIEYSREGINVASRGGFWPLRK